jgi:hypothetical protein
VKECVESKTYLRSSKVLFAVEVHNEHVGWLHQLFLNTTGCDVDLVLMANARSSTSTRYLVKAECQLSACIVLPIAITGEEGQFIPIQEYRTLRKAYRYGWRDGWGLPSAQEPRRRGCWSSF